MTTKEFTGVKGYTKCNKCGGTIAITRQFFVDKGERSWYGYESENLDCRYIDKWGFARNFCKTCMK